jgi:hypothetical protein
MLGFICDGSKLCDALPVLLVKSGASGTRNQAVAQCLFGVRSGGGLDLLGFMFDCVEVSVLG